MESTKEHPIAFFESFIVDGGLELSKNEYIEDVIAHSGVHIININYDNGIVTFLDVDEKRNTIEQTYKYNLKLKNILCYEFTQSKKLIDKAVVGFNLTLEPAKEDNYFLYIQRTLQYILNKGESKIIQFPILLKPIEGISNYINEKYRTDNKIVLQIPIFKTSDTNDEFLICQILGYLQGENDKREKIMSDKQYDLMISYVQSYIDTNQIPEIPIKIAHVNIPKNLLRFTFYFLHQKICPNFLKKEFVNFLQILFIDFDFETNKSLYKKFASVDKITIQGVKFIPEIIKEEVKNKREK